MKIALLVIGKSDAEYLRKGIEIYEKRMRFYSPYEMIIIPDLKNRKSLSEKEQKEREGELILNVLESTDRVILLDEKGEEYRSKEFARFLTQKMHEGIKRLVFVIGGPYGFSDSVYKRAAAGISLSRMTFSHQLVRIIFIEQLYRAFTIIRGEPYHHE